MAAGPWRYSRPRPRSSMAALTCLKLSPPNWASCSLIAPEHIKPPWNEQPLVSTSSRLSNRALEEDCGPRPPSAIRPSGVEQNILAPIREYVKPQTSGYLTAHGDPAYAVPVFVEPGRKHGFPLRVGV